jgi:hypothetical protein
MGLLTERATGWHPAPPEIKEARQMSIQFTTNNPNIATTLVGTANPENMVKKCPRLESPLDQTFLSQVQGSYSRFATQLAERTCLEQLTEALNMYTRLEKGSDENTCAGGARAPSLSRN